MPWFENDAAEERHKYLRRIAEALEDIARSLRRQPEVRSVDFMALPTGPLAPGDTGTFTATAADASGNPVAGATPSVAGDDAGNFVTYSSDGANPATITYTAVADGTSNVTGTFTNPDGTVISTGTDNPDAITVATPVPDVAAVNFA